MTLKLTWQHWSVKLNAVAELIYEIQLVTNNNICPTNLLLLGV